MVLFSTFVRAVCSSAATKFIYFESFIIAAATTAHHAAFDIFIFFQLLLLSKN